MTWHFQEADEDFAEIQAGGTLQPSLQPSLQPACTQPATSRTSGLQPWAPSLQATCSMPATPRPVGAPRASVGAGAACGRGLGLLLRRQRGAARHM